MKTVLNFIQVAALIALSPLITGIIAKAKNNIRMRKGAGVFQPYYNLFKLLGKEVILPVNSSWIFRFAPYAALASSVAAAFIILPAAPRGSFAYGGDLFVLFSCCRSAGFSSRSPASTREARSAGWLFKGNVRQRDGGTGRPGGAFRGSLSSGSTVPAAAGAASVYFAPVIAERLFSSWRLPRPPASRWITVKRILS